AMSACRGHAGCVQSVAPGYDIYDLRFTIYESMPEPDSEPIEPLVNRQSSIVNWGLSWVVCPFLREPADRESDNMNSHRSTVFRPGSSLIGALFSILQAKGQDKLLRLTLRSRVGSQSPGQDSVIVEKKAAWDPKRTAIIICDMWDNHWCQSAARRVAELAGP